MRRESNFSKVKERFRCKKYANPNTNNEGKIYTYITDRYMTLVDSLCNELYEYL